MSINGFIGWLLLLAVTVFSPQSLASVELQPGQLSANLPADQIIVTPCIDPNIFNAPFHECEGVILPAENRFKIVTTIRAPFPFITNKGPAVSTALMQQLFHIAASPSGEETTIPATIYIRPIYQGVVDARAKGVSSTMLLTLTVQSRTTGRIAAHKEIVDLRVEGDSKIVKIPGTPIGLPLPVPSIENPSGSFLHVMSVNLVRGHYYKVELKLHSKVEAFNLSFLGRGSVDFFNEDMVLPGEDNLIDPLFPREGPYIGWDFLQIDVGDDPFVRIEELEEQVIELEERIESLDERTRKKHIAQQDKIKAINDELKELKRRNSNQEDTSIPAFFRNMLGIFDF